MPEIELEPTTEPVVAYCEGCATNFMLPRTLVKRMADVEDKRIRCEICGNLFLSLNVRKESELPSLDGQHVWKARADMDSRAHQRGDIIEQYK